MKNTTTTNALPDFSDPRVKLVYDLLCEHDVTDKPEDDHWEGWIARRIVAALASAAPPANLACPSVQKRLATQWGYVHTSAAPSEREPHPPHRDCGCAECAPSFEPDEPTLTVTMRYDLSPDAIEGAIRNKLIEMGWTPPDAAAPRAAPAPAAVAGPSEARAYRTDAEIVEQTVALTKYLLDWKWGLTPEGDASRIWESKNTKAQVCWNAACHIQDLLTQTDVWNALANIEGEEAAPTTQAAPEAVAFPDPVGYLYCGGDYGNELEDWEIVADQAQCDRLNEHYGALGKEARLPIYAGSLPTAQAALQQPAPAVCEPCGGCGEDNPAKRCIGCRHQFAATPQHALPDKALDYLKRKGLQGSPLRPNATSSPAAQQSGATNG